MPKLLGESLSTLEMAAAKADVVLHYDVAENLPDWVRLDAKRLRQILLNLNNQTIRLTQSGKMRINAMLLNAAEPELAFKKPCLSVSFSGYRVGITQPFLEQLFASSFDAENIYSGRSTSAGMGLEIARNLAKTMEGDIRTECQPNGDFVFKLLLPLHVEDAPQVNEVELRTSPSLESKPINNLKLLIAEDSPVNQLYLKRVLEKMGHSIHFVDTGLAALECLKAEDFDAVLLDYHMPIVNGVEATTMIRRLEGAKSQIKIIMVTADVLGDTREKAMQAGVNELLTKPVSAQQLHKVLTEID
jgi:hypothetical protein